MKSRKEDPSVAVAAALAAAISLLERGGKAAKKAAPSDKMFDQMLRDYKRALADWRKAQAKPKTKKVRNLMSGKEIEIPEDTPLACDPSSETYWSM